jgi:hypothetical protein
MELLKVSNATIVPTPMAMPRAKNMDLPFRRFRLAKASVLIRIIFLSLLSS